MAMENNIFKQENEDAFDRSNSIGNQVNQPLIQTVKELAPLANVENFEEVEEKNGFSGRVPNSGNSPEEVDEFRLQKGKAWYHYAQSFGHLTGTRMDGEVIPDVNIYQHKKTVAQGMMDLALFSANANQLRYVLENPNHPYYNSGITLIVISIIFQSEQKILTTKTYFCFNMWNSTDVNIYQNKQTIAKGFLDIALFSANANQFRYILESDIDENYYYLGLVLLFISLLCQVLVGIGLILNTRYDVKDRKEICLANKINNSTIIGIFLVTVINVFISAFGVASGSNVVATSNT